MTISKIIPKLHPQTAGRVIDGEAVLMLADASEIHVLNSVGSLIYEYADGSHTLGQISHKIAEQFNVSRQQALADAKQFVDEMAARNIFVLENDLKNRNQT